jgi:hypothetical protein
MMSAYGNQGIPGSSPTGLPGLVDGLKHPAQTFV